MRDGEVAAYLIQHRARLMKRADTLGYYRNFMYGAVRATQNVLLGRYNPNREQPPKVRRK